LQGLFASVLPRTQHAGAPAIAAASYCEPQRDHGAPPLDEHSPCCVLCATGRDEPPALVDELIAPLFDAPDVAAFSLADGWGDPPDGRPIGWASSWSSRAPPAA
jgi:hypothetical protein